jgi:DNA-binding MarR family transcriptional regulator
MKRRPPIQYHTDQADLAVPEDREVEVSAVVSEFTQRLRKLEESLVDQKVKMEILELRASRAVTTGVSVAPPAKLDLGSTSLDQIDNAERPSAEKMDFITDLKSLSPQKDGPEANKKLGTTEIEALRLVFEGRGKISAREIQQRIGRTREHTARLMNSLYHDGLVERDVTARPFSYSITEKGRDVLNG